MAVNKNRLCLTAVLLLGLLGSAGLLWKGTTAPVPGTPPAGDPAEPVREDRLEDRRPSAAAARGASAGPLELLDLVQASSDGIAGRWGFQGQALISPAVSRGRLQLPCLPPSEYDLRLRVTRKQGVNALRVGLVVSGVPAVLNVDDRASRSSWISLADAPPPEFNETAVRGKILKWNLPTLLEISVRRGRISLSAAGRKVLEWQGNPNDLFMEPGLFVPNPGALSIGSKDTIFRFDEIKLTPVSGEPTLLR